MAIHTSLKYNLLIIIGILFTIIIIQFCIIFYDTNKYNYINNTNLNPQQNGYINDETTAIRIAESVLLPIYGKEILNEKPFHATLKNDSIWVIDGTQKKGDAAGTVYVEIQKKDCKIIKLFHYK